MLKECRGSRRAPLGLFFYNEKGEPTIFVNSILKKLKFWVVTKQTIHHEMAHLDSKNRDSHGPSFKRRMRGLVNKGAYDTLF